jgi:hypothetical protein
MKRVIAFFLIIICIALLCGCSGNSANQPTPQKAQNTTPPLTISTEEQAEFELNKYMQQHSDKNFEGAVVIIKSRGKYDAFHYAKLSGLHAIYKDAAEIKLPYRMSELTDSETQIVRIFIYDADIDADIALINSMYAAINEKRYEDYAELFSNFPYAANSIDYSMLESVGDEEAEANKTGIYGIDMVSDTEVLGIMPLDGVYGENWHRRVIPQTASSINPNDPATIESYFEKHNPLIYLVRNEFTLIEDSDDTGELKSGTNYWVIAVGDDEGVRKIQGIWIPSDDTIAEYMPKNAD